MTVLMISWQSEPRMSHMLVFKWKKEEQLYFSSAGVGNCTGANQCGRLIYAFVVCWYLWKVGAQAKIFVRLKENPSDRFC